MLHAGTHYISQLHPVTPYPDPSLRVPRSIPPRSPSLGTLNAEHTPTVVSDNTWRTPPPYRAPAAGSSHTPVRGFISLPHRFLHPPLTTDVSSEMLYGCCARAVLALC